MNCPFKFIVIITVLLIFLFACTFSPLNVNNEAEIPITGDITESPQVELLPPDQPAEPPAPTDTPEPTATAEPTAEPLPTEIVHLVSPIVSILSEKPQVIYDQESILEISPKRSLRRG